MCNQEVNSMQVYKNTNTDFKQLTQPLIQSSGLNFTHRGRYSEGVWWGIVAFGCRISKDDKKCIKDSDLLNGYLSKKQHICNMQKMYIFLWPIFKRQISWLETFYAIQFSLDTLRNCYIMISCLIWTATNMICSKSSKYVHVYIILEISTEVLMGDHFMEYFKINDAKFRLASCISAVFE